MKIEYQNMVALLAKGAFDTPVEVEPMSDFKWQRLVALADSEDVSLPLRYALQRTLYGNVLTEKQRVASQEIIDYRTNLYKDYINRSKPMTRFNSVMSRMRMNHLFNSEIHCIDTSMPTLALLDIIALSLYEALYGRLSLKALLMIGLYLRQEGDTVDFVKLETFLNEVGLRKIANLFGTILVENFGFTAEEVPFLYKNDPHAQDILEGYYKLADREFIRVRHKVRVGDITLTDDPYRLPRSARRGLSYARYHRTEAWQNYLSNLLNIIRNIEE